MLTTQKRKFALAMMSGKNRTAAAIEAGYSAKSARCKGSQLAKDPEVLAFIARRKREKVEVDEVPVYRRQEKTPEDRTHSHKKPVKPSASGTGDVKDTPPAPVSAQDTEYMEDGLPDPLKAMGRILGENIGVDPKLALDAAYKLAQFTHQKKGDMGKKAAKNEAAKKAGNRFAVPAPPPRLVINNHNRDGT